MTRNEFRFIGVIVGEIEQITNQRHRFYIEVAQRNGRSTTYPIYLSNLNRAVDVEDVKKAKGKAVWMLGYIDNFENNLSLILQEFMVLECPN